ncbi:putative Oxidoreductase, zinc-binding dehydrogenase family protein [Hibiscus syriacus]|uniref:Oxidoreductase, zinc-binding dehydrogenase family protein n=1 Tax=Hibiscus syriacus TaxID=106335 RepID=A0A6A2XKP6_HIBSY|nr:putative Oxidoreductase, zinc-binding dehydrogenase family protein [Hibiscus syriacus]
MNATNNANYKVKFMCSYGGKIQPRSHDNQLAYVGGDTKILAVDRNIKFSAIMAKLSSLYGGGSEVCFKYQLPGEDLDALISVTNDEDLEHMMMEYDRSHRVSAKPPGEGAGFCPFPGCGGSPGSCCEGCNGGSDCGSEDRHVIVDPMMSPAEIQRQIHELQKMHISATQEQGIMQRKVDESNAKAYNAQDYSQMPDKIAPSPAPVPVPAPLQMSIQTAYLTNTAYPYLRPQPLPRMFTESSGFTMRCQPQRLVLTLRESHLCCPRAVCLSQDMYRWLMMGWKAGVFHSGAIPGDATVTPAGDVSGDNQDGKLRRTLRFLLKLHLRKLN